MSKKIETRDLIDLGIFTALYFVTAFATGMVGYIPILIPLVPALCSLTTGIPFMLFLAKAQKFGMITLMGTLSSILMTLGGHPWFIALPSGIIMSLLGDLIMRAGGYQKWKFICLGYIVFCEWATGLLSAIFIMRESYFAQTRDGYGDAYANALLAITPPWVFPLIVLATALGALGGAFLGRAILKKHFLRVGIL
jgi:energy-coupling factor transport system substrate-specific component